MKNKKKFEPVDHSKYCTFVSYVVIKQRCSYCGEYYNLSDRGIGAKITKDEMICLCAKCNIPYRRKTWVEKNIEAVKKEIKIIRDLGVGIEPFIDRECETIFESTPLRDDSKIPKPIG